MWLLAQDNEPTAFYVLNGLLQRFVPAGRMCLKAALIHNIKREQSSIYQDVVRSVCCMDQGQEVKVTFILTQKKLCILKRRI